MNKDNKRIISKSKAIIIVSTLISVSIILIAILAAIFNRNSTVNASAEAKNNYNGIYIVNVDNTTNSENIGIVVVVNTSRIIFSVGIGLPVISSLNGNVIAYNPNCIFS